MTTTSDCVSIGRHLGAFVDGELRGTRMLRVLGHVDACVTCAERVHELRDLGDALRAAAPASELHMLDGLASTVISRTRAEAAQSWWGLWERATDDWHWLIVGAGSVAATFTLTVFLSALLAFGVGPIRDDSLSGLIDNLQPPPEYVFLWVTPVGDDRDAMLMQLDDGSPAASRATVNLVSRTSDQITEADLVDALSAVVTREGHQVNLARMVPADRGIAEALLGAISDTRLNEPLSAGVTEVKVHEIRYVTSTSVTAKGL